MQLAVVLQTNNLLFFFFLCSKFSLQCAKVPLWFELWLELLHLLKGRKLGLLEVVGSLKGGSQETLNSLTNTYMKQVGKVSIHPSLSPSLGWSNKICPLWEAFSRSKDWRDFLSSLETFIQKILILQILHQSLLHCSLDGLYISFLVYHR